MDSFTVTYHVCGEQLGLSALQQVVRNWMYIPIENDDLFSWECIGVKTNQTIVLTGTRKPVVCTHPRSPCVECQRKKFKKLLPIPAKTATIFADEKCIMVKKSIDPIFDTQEKELVYELPAKFCAIRKNIYDFFLENFDTYFPNFVKTKTKLYKNAIYIKGRFDTLEPQKTRCLACRKNVTEFCSICDDCDQNPSVTEKQRMYWEKAYKKIYMVEFFRRLEEGFTPPVVLRMCVNNLPVYLVYAKKK